MRWLKKIVYDLIKKEKSIPFDKQKEIFYKFVPERTEEVKKLCNRVNFENLIYYCKSSTKNINFNYFTDAETLSMIQSLRE